jgi:hypothetical protein
MERIRSGEGSMLWNTFSVCGRAVGRALDHMPVRNLHYALSAITIAHASAQPPHVFLEIRSVWLSIFNWAWRQPFLKHHNLFTNLRRPSADFFPLRLSINDVKHWKLLKSRKMIWSVGPRVDQSPCIQSLTSFRFHSFIPYRFNFQLQATTNVRIGPISSLL